MYSMEGVKNNASNYLIASLWQFGDETVEVIENSQWDVRGYSTRSDVCGVHTSTGNAFIKLKHFFALLGKPKERCYSTNVKDMCSHSHKMVHNASHFDKKC